MVSAPQAASYAQQIVAFASRGAGAAAAAARGRQPVAVAQGPGAPLAGARGNWPDPLAYLASGGRLLAGLTQARVLGPAFQYLVQAGSGVRMAPIVSVTSRYNPAAYAPGGVFGALFSPGSQGLWSRQSLAFVGVQAGFALAPGAAEFLVARIAVPTLDRLAPPAIAYASTELGPRVRAGSGIAEMAAAAAQGSRGAASAADAAYPTGEAAGRVTSGVRVSLAGLGRSVVTGLRFAIPVGIGSAAVYYGGQYLGAGLAAAGAGLAAAEQGLLGYTPGTGGGGGGGGGPPGGGPGGGGLLGNIPPLVLIVGVIVVAALAFRGGGSKSS